MAKKLLLVFVLLLKVLLYERSFAQNYILDKDFEKCGTNTTSFQGLNASLTKTIILPDGGILSMGSASKSFTNEFYTTVAKYLSNGKLDSLNFGVDGKVAFKFNLWTVGLDMSVQPDGKIVISGVDNISDGGSSSIPAVFRLNQNGSIDSSFGDGGIKTLRFDPISSGKLESLALLPDGKIVTAGASSGNINGGMAALGLMKFKADGQLDSAFVDSSGVPGRSRVSLSTPYISDVHVFLESEGDIIVPFIQNFDGIADTKIMIARLSDSGSLKKIINTGIRSSNLIVKKHPDGKYLFTGTLNDPGSLRKIQVVRYKTDLSLDESFGFSGRVILNTMGGAMFDNDSHGLSVHPNGKIIIIGHKSTPNLSSSEYRILLIHLLPDGKIDSGFNGTGFIEPLLFNRNSAPLVDVNALGNDKFLVSSSEDFGLARFATDTTDLSTVAKADFNFIRNGATFYFDNFSKNAISTSWDFGDGQTSSTLVNPQHTYANKGGYTVCLTGYNSCENDQTCKLVGIKGIRDIQPNHVSNTGYHMTFLHGFFPDSTATVKLIRAGYQDIFANATIYIDVQTLKVNFKLQDADIGLWDVVISSKSLNDTLFSSFNIESLNNIIPRVQIIGPSDILLGKFYKIRVAVENIGNQTLFGVPVWLVMDPSYEAVLINDVITDSIAPNFIDSLYHFYEYKDSASGLSLKLSWFLIPVLSAGSTQFIDFYVRTVAQGNHIIKAYANTGYYNQSSIGLLRPININSDCFGSPLPPCINCLLDALGVIPVISCGAATFQITCSIGNYINGKGSGLIDLFGNASYTLINCLPYTSWAQNNKEVAKGLLKKAGWLSSGGSVNSGLGVIGPSDCSTGCNPPDPPGTNNATLVSSYDPNVKEGPGGFTSEKYISGLLPSYFTIKFENVNTATAPALEINLIDTIDASVFDLSSFKFTGFGFGDTTVYFPFERNEFATDVDLRPVKNVIVRVKGKLDTLSHIAKWTFSSFDPLTMKLTDSIFDGFLPPNVNSPAGEGFVMFHVKPFDSLPHLRKLVNNASIIFDNNAPVITPLWINTIDKNKPNSFVNPLPATISDTTFTIYLTGTDANSGVSVYDLYVSINDSAYFKFSHDVSGDSAVIVGQIGKKYKFYSIAKDNVGNIEEPPASPDAVTVIGNSLPISLLYFKGQKWQNIKTKLIWKMVVDNEYAYTAIERSKNNLSLDSIGVSTQKIGNNEVQWIDEHPYEGENYYRLKFIDKDNKYTYSPIVKITFSGTEQVEIFPNPTSGLITISGLPLNEITEIQLFDIHGRLLKKEMSTVSSLILDIRKEASGIYLIRIKNTQQLIQSKVSKLK